MAALTEAMKRVVREQRLGFVATVCPDGTPNLSPKGCTFIWDDDHLLIADIRSPGTVENLRQRPVAEVNVVDPLARRGFRFKGTCTVHTEGELYDQIVTFLRDHGVRSPIRSGVLLRVERALPLTSPAYDRGATEQELRKRWKMHFDALQTQSVEAPPGE